MAHKVLVLLIFCAVIGGCASTPRAPVDARASTAEPTRRAASPAERSEGLLMALMALGVDYRLGGRSGATGFDCSGLVAYVYEEAYGIRVPRTVLGQSATGIAVRAEDLEPGDLVFYDTLGHPYSHVGIYMGDGKFVHAPKTGSTVRIENLRSSYWTKRFTGARRIEIPL
jgi:cell wall-associated NlpC family hydrolase